MKRDELITWLKKDQNTFHPVVPFDPVKDTLLSIDFTENNKQLTEEIISDTGKFTTYINNKLSAAGATYGMGGYAEKRSVYRRSGLFGSANEESEEEPRRLHLGVDIWGKPHTK